MLYREMEKRPVSKRRRMLTHQPDHRSVVRSTYFYSPSVGFLTPKQWNTVLLLFAGEHTRPSHSKYPYTQARTPRAEHMKRAGAFESGALPATDHSYCGSKSPVYSFQRCQRILVQTCRRVPLCLDSLVSHVWFALLSGCRCVARMVHTQENLDFTRL